MPSSTAGAPVSPVPTALTGGPVPLYHQLCQVLRGRLAAGEWQPGEQIPTIRELCDTYAVSRITVVQAIGALSQEGLLTRRQGKGIFVAEPKIEHGPIRLLSFTEETTRRGHAAASRMLALRREPASPEVAARLALAPGAPVVLLQRLRLADGEPMGVQTSYLPERLFPDLADVAEPIASLYTLFVQRYGVLPTDATDTYTPVRLDRETAQLLEVAPGSPAFSVQRLTRDQHHRLIEFVVSLLRGDRYQVVLQLRRLVAP